MKLALSDLTSPEAVQAALDEFTRLGQSAFLAEHGFGKAGNYLVKNPRTGEWADSKAIVSDRHIPASRGSAYTGHLSR